MCVYTYGLEFRVSGLGLGCRVRGLGLHRGNFGFRGFRDLHNYQSRGITLKKLKDVETACNIGLGSILKNPQYQSEVYLRYPEVQVCKESRTTNLVIM